MGLADYKLKFVIDADGTTAKQELNAIYGKINQLGGSLSGTFGGAIPLVGAFAGALTGAGVAVAGAGAALFQITKNAAEFGSTIYDATQKTGLGATAISSLKAAAEQSGSSLEAVTGGIAKFAKNYKGTSDDLQGELGKVFKQISEAKPGFEQLTLAQKNFGRGGGDLIPVIRSFGGDIEGLTKHMSDLGLTIDDKAAYEADQFGDQMDILDGQIAGVGRTIGTALMPEFTRMAREMGTFITNNKSEIQEWADITADSISAVARMANQAAVEIHNLGIESGRLKKNDNGTYSGSSFLSTYGGALGAWFETNRADAAYARENTYGPFASEMSTGGNKPSVSPGATTGGGKGTSAAKPKFQLSSQGKAIMDAANALGVSALDLATIIGFESAGSYSPSKIGGAGNKYKGLIQFGPQEQSKYGVKSGQSFENQVTTSVVKFLKDRFASVGRSTAGASIVDLYRTVLGGNPNASLTGVDANGTSPLSGVQKMLRDHRPAALKKFFGGSESNAKGDSWGSGYKSFEDAAANDAAAAKKDDDDFMAYAEKVLQDWIAAEKQAADERLDIRRSENNLAEEMLRGQLDQELITETEYSDRIGQLKIDALQDERDEIADQISSRENIHRLQMLDLAITQAKLEKENAIKKALKDQNDERLNAINGLQKKNQRPGEGLETRVEVDKKFDGIAQLKKYFSGEIKNKKGELFSGNQDFGVAAIDAASLAFNQLGQAVGAAVESFVLYGSAGASVRQVTAQILASIAQQASIQAVYELAQGLAVLALAYFGVPNAGPSATAHFASAAMYGVIAGGAAIAGRAVAGNSFKQGASGGGGHAQGTGAPGSPGSGGNRSAESLTPYSRTSSSAYHSGQNSAIGELANEIAQFRKQLGSQTAGNILTVGIKQRPGLIGNQVATDIGRNSAIGTKILRNAGVK